MCLTNCMIYIAQIYTAILCQPEQDQLCTQMFMLKYLNGYSILDKCFVSCCCRFSTSFCLAFSLQVIDPSMPEDGMRVNGEFIQAPSEEVLEHKEKNPQNTILVRFFDGRRTW